MLRLNNTDFDDPHELAKLAATTGISIDEFKNTFGYLIENDMLYHHIQKGNIKLASTESSTGDKPLPGSVIDNLGDATPK